MEPLSKNMTRAGLSELRLKKRTRRKLMRILELMDDSSRAEVAMIRCVIFGNLTGVAADAALGRLLAKLNTTAKNSGSPLRAITLEGYVHFISLAVDEHMDKTPATRHPPSRGTVIIVSDPFGDRYHWLRILGAILSRAPSPEIFEEIHQLIMALFQ